jgi:hypothetical protein
VLLHTVVIGHEIIGGLDEGKKNGKK